MDVHHGQPTGGQDARRSQYDLLSLPGAGQFRTQRESQVCRYGESGQHGDHLDLVAGHRNQRSDDDYAVGHGAPERPGTGFPTTATSVQFLDITSGTTTLGTTALNASGVATLAISTLASGNRQLVAQYVGDSNFNTSTSPTIGVTVVAKPAATTTVLTANPVSPSVFQQGVIFQATVTPSAGALAAIQGGNVQFFDNGVLIGTATTNASGVATLTSIATLTVGNHTIRADYQGVSGTFSTSTSTISPYTVSPASTTTTLTTSAANASSGTSVTLTASIAAVAPEATSPTSAGSKRNVPGYHRWCNNYAGHVGSERHFQGGNAHYLDDSDRHPQHHRSVCWRHQLHHQHVDSPDGSDHRDAGFRHDDDHFGEPVGLRSTGDDLDRRDGSIFDANRHRLPPRCAATVTTTTLNALGQASFAISNLTVGTHNLTVFYSGNDTYASSISTRSSRRSTTPTRQCQRRRLPWATSRRPCTARTVTFTATVTAGRPGLGTPTGNVTFFDGTTALGTSNLLNGVATLTVGTPINNYLSVDPHSITAQYNGDVRFNQSVSPVLNLVIGKAATTIQNLTANINPTSLGQPVTFIATIGTQAAGVATGTVTFFDGGNVIGSGAVGIVSTNPLVLQASLTISSLARPRITSRRSTSATRISTQVRNRASWCRWSTARPRLAP